MADSQGFIGRPGRIQGKVAPTADPGKAPGARDPGEAYGLSRISAEDKPQSKVQSALSSHQLDLKSVLSEEEEKRAANMMQNP